jgi:hypothetical protein
VPIFLERFLLPLLAGVVILIAVTNPMGFDLTQRITGAVALLCAAYFIAHTVYKKPVPEELFVADVLQFFPYDDVTKTPPNFWIANEGKKAQIPVEAALIVRICELATPASSFGQFLD